MKNDQRVQSGNGDQAEDFFRKFFGDELKLQEQP
jgi:hypothetical protein